MTKRIARNTAQREERIARRQKRDQEAVLKQLRKIPIISVACDRAGIGRTTFYNWCRESEVFERAVDAAMAEGDQLMNDMSESQLLSLEKDKHWPSIKYHLDRRHPKFLSEKRREALEKKADLKIIVLKEHETQL